MLKKFDRDGRLVEMDEDGGFWIEEETDNRYAMLGMSPPQRSKCEWPYSYDPFIVWFGSYKKGDNGVYSDRLYQ